MSAILHIAPENYTGILMDFVEAHRQLGNRSNLVTMYKCVNDYREDICLHLPMVGYKKSITAIKRLFPSGPAREQTPDTPKTREPGGLTERLFFSLRDRLWAPRVRAAFERYGFWDYDIYHLEGGMGFLRSGKFIRELKNRGKKIVCNYHGLDLRIRGALPQIDRLSDLNLTCEWDLLQYHPDIHYLFLPFDCSRYEPRRVENTRLRIVHSPRMRVYKGSEHIIAVVRELEKEHDVELVLIEGKTHAEAMAIKKTCDLAIDQVVENQHHHAGGTGYGVNSLETLSLGIPTLTNIPDDYEAFIPDHPFIKVTPATLKASLAKLITDRELRRRHAEQGRAWVIRRHDRINVTRQLYALYRERGWMDAPAAPPCPAD